MKKWKKEHNEAIITVLQKMVNNPRIRNKNRKVEYGGWLRALASMVGHLAAATGNKASAFQGLAEGMEEFDSLASEKFFEKKFGKRLDKDEEL